MNKDIKGLIVYLLLMSITWTFPFLVVYFFFGALYYDNSTLLVILYLLQTIAFFILYFILPVILTYFAIKKHWSRYLDKFFNRWLWPTLILITLLLLPVIFKVDEIQHTNWDLSRILYGFYISVIPACCLAYIVIFIHNLIKSVKRIKEYFHKNRDRINL